MTRLVFFLFISVRSLELISILDILIQLEVAREKIPADSSEN